MLGTSPGFPALTTSPGKGYGPLWFVLGFWDSRSGLVLGVQKAPASPWDWGCHLPADGKGWVNSWFCFTSCGFGAVLSGCPGPELKQRESVPFGKHQASLTSNPFSEQQPRNLSRMQELPVKNGVCRARGTVPTS